MTIEIIILAAGKGTRMRSTLPKVLHEIGGKPMLQHIILASLKLNPKAIHVIVGHGKESVIKKMEEVGVASEQNTTINWVEQTEQLGTGHAVMQAMPHISPQSTVLILNGDTPLIQPETLSVLLDTQDGLNLLTVNLDDPSGMGRILRDDAGKICGIVEHKDASKEQLSIHEINTNCMAGNAGQIQQWLSEVKSDNTQNEYYLPDIVSGSVNSGIAVNGFQPENKEEVAGINSKSDLCHLERVFQLNQAEHLMACGVTLRDANRIDIRGDCQFGSDCVIDVNVILEGNVIIGDNCTIGANCIIKNSVIGNDCHIEPNSLIDQSTLGDHCHIGPFARLRPGTKLANTVKIGNFVETKNAQIDNGSKVNHLSYVGDSVIGENVNVGAGVITCNYDGKNKHQTTIGDGVFVGSGSQLVAPVEIGSHSTIGAGSTITRPVPAESLALTRSKQKSIDNWVNPSRKTDTSK